MSGILFLQTKELAPLVVFYTRTIECEIWLEQADCVILRHGNFQFGFCERDNIQADALLTFFYDSREEVDAIYRKVRDTARGQPQDNDKYRIYQFFAADPDGRGLEFQYFNDPMGGYRSGDDLLRGRRSVRHFSDRQVDDRLLRRVVDLARWAPTSYNCQAFAFHVIRDRSTIDWLGRCKGDASGPIGRAPAAVAIVVDPEKSVLPVQDGALAAHQFMLAAAWLGLGTCWIGSMDEAAVKDRLGIPVGHHLVTVTPLGYPLRATPPPDRKPVEEFLK